MKRLFPYLVCYIFWIISMYLGYHDLEALRALGGLILGQVLGTDLKVLMLIDKIGIFLFGAVGLVIIVFTEAYYSKGIVSKNLFERFGLVTGIEFLVLFVCDGIILLMSESRKEVNTSLVVFWTEFLVGVIGISFFFWSKKFGWDQKDSRL